jgi:hypothetical protein
MHTAPFLPPDHTEPAHDLTEPGEAARVRFRQPVSSSGFIDAAWWPRSLDLTSELPPLLEVLWTSAREITRITFNTAAWGPAPRRMRVEGRTVRLGGFMTSDPLTVRLSDPWGAERIDILVIAPDTDPGLAHRIFEIATQAHSPYRAQEILDQANGPTADRADR